MRGARHHAIHAFGCSRPRPRRRTPYRSSQLLAAYPQNPSSCLISPKRFASSPIVLSHSPPVAGESEWILFFSQHGKGAEAPPNHCLPRSDFPVIKLLSLALQSAESIAANSDGTKRMRDIENTSILCMQNAPRGAKTFFTQRSCS